MDHSVTYDAIVFDNDGVLTHPTSTSVLVEAARRTFDEFDVDPDESDVDTVVSGTLNRVCQTCDGYDIDPGEFWLRREANAAAAQRRAMERGAKPLCDDFDALDDLAVPLGVVSNNQHETIRHLLDVFDVADRFEVAVGRDPTLDGFRRRKPDPHYLDGALDALGAANALYVGDSNVDVVAARRAGVDSAYVRRPHRGDDYLAAEPTHVVDSLQELTSVA